MQNQIQNKVNILEETKNIIEVYKILNRNKFYYSILIWPLNLIAIIGIPYLLVSQFSWLFIFLPMYVLAMDEFLYVDEISATIAKNIGAGKSLHNKIALFKEEIKKLNSELELFEKIDNREIISLEEHEQLLIYQDICKSYSLASQYSYSSSEYGIYYCFISSTKIESYISNINKKIKDFTIPNRLNETSNSKKHKENIVQKNESRIISNNTEHISVQISEQDDENQIEIDTTELREKTKKQKIYKNSWTIINTEKMEIGELGELIIMNEENLKLGRLGLSNLKPKHVSKLIGDGLGYDIESYNEHGDKIHIEVKTTRGNSHKFYITPNEYRTMKRLNSSYYIKRVYNIDEQTKSYEIETISANAFIENFKLVPSNFIAVRK